LRPVINHGHNLDIIAILYYQKAKGLRELQRALGCTFDTFYNPPFNWLIDDVVIEVVQIGQQTIYRLTEKGKEIAAVLESVGQLPYRPVPKLREVPILMILRMFGQVLGKTRFMKLVFVLVMEYATKTLKNYGEYRFDPGDYGPFSKHLAKDLDELLRFDLIKVHVEKVDPSIFADGQKDMYVYALNETRLDAARLASAIPAEMISAIQTLFDRFKNKELIELLRYVYRKYPDFITNSKIVEQVLGKAEEQTGPRDEGSDTPE